MMHVQSVRDHSQLLQYIWSVTQNWTGTWRSEGTIFMQVIYLFITKIILKVQ